MYIFQIVITLVLLSLSCGRENQEENKVHSLFFEGNFLTRFPEVCWLNNGDQDKKEWAKKAVESSWGSYAMVRFPGWKSCPQNDPELTWKYLVIRTKGENSDGSLGWSLIPWKPNSNPQMILWFEGLNIKEMVEWAAIHEFGHVLGFDHEHYRYDRPREDCYKRIDIPSISILPDHRIVGEYDDHSIMDYCYKSDNKPDKYLSRWDIAMIKLSSIVSLTIQVTLI